MKLLGFKTLLYKNKQKQSNICFVNFSNGNYIQGQKVLINSIIKVCSSMNNSCQYDILAFTKFEEIGSPTHKESPYEFKFHAIKKAKDLGYEIVVWVDSSMRLVKPIDSIIKKVKDIGIYIQQDRFFVGQWANDETLNFFNVTRDDALKIPNAYACILIFDFTNIISITFLDEIFKCASVGLFRGQWNNKNKTESQDERCLGHRHDQSCIELIANKFNIQKQPLICGPVFPKSEFAFEYGV
jgi:hypothetical protein